MISIPWAVCSAGATVCSTLPQWSIVGFKPVRCFKALLLRAGCLLTLVPPCLSSRTALCSPPQIKEAQDARVLRAAIVNVLEEACLPGVTDDEKRRLLTFVASPPFSVVTMRLEEDGGEG